MSREYGSEMEFCKSLDGRGFLERIKGAWNSLSIACDSSRGSISWKSGIGIWVLLRFSRAVFIGVWRKVAFYDNKRRERSASRSK
jgi:hypothetical protein